MPAVCRELRDATASDKLSSLDDQRLQNKRIHDFLCVPLQITKPLAITQRTRVTLFGTLQQCNVARSLFAT